MLKILLSVRDLSEYENQFHCCLGIQINSGIVLSVISERVFSENYFSQNLAGNYLLRVSNRNTRARCEICSKLTIKTPEQCKWHCSSVFNVDFEHILHLVLVFLLLTLKMSLPAGKLQTKVHKTFISKWGKF